MHRLPLARALAARGVDTHVAIPFRADDPRFQGHDFSLHRLSLRRGSLNPFAEARVLVELVSLSRRLRPAIVHNVTIKPVLYGSMVARLTDTPCIVNSITGLGYVFSSSEAGARVLKGLVLPWLRYGCNRRNVTMLFENEDDLDVYRSAGVTVEAHSHVVPSSGIEPALFRVREHKPGAVTVMLLGRMLWDKGVGEFVEAAQAVRRAAPATRFVLVGGTDPNPESIPEEKLREWQDQGILEYWGWRTDVPQVLESADILCLPSYREGLPRALLEGGAAGLALITTDVPGCRDAVRSGVSALVVPPRDPHALAQAILNLVTSVELRSALGAEARADVAQRFAVKSVIDRTFRVYEESLCRCT